MQPITYFTAELHLGSKKIADLKDVSLQQETKELHTGLKNVLRAVVASKWTWRAKVTSLAVMELPMKEELTIWFGDHSAALVGCWITVSSYGTIDDPEFCTVTGWARDYFQKPVVVSDPNKPNPQIVKELIQAVTKKPAATGKTAEKKLAVPTYPLPTKRHVDFED